MPFTAGLGRCAVVPAGILTAPVELKATFWFGSIITALVLLVCSVRLAVPSDVLTRAVIEVVEPALASIVLMTLFVSKLYHQQKPRTCQA